MVTHTLIDTDDGLGETVATYLFDIHLARSLLRSSTATVAASLVGIGLTTRVTGRVVEAPTLTPVVLGGLAMAASWGVLIAATRLRRRSDLFVIRRFGLAHHHDGRVSFTRWVDIAGVTHSGSGRRSRLSRWAGGEYCCRVDLRDGSTSTFDNYVLDAATLGSEIERRSLL